ncbi:MAG: GntR family transcriptional regulator [Bacteroidia bacterium]|nr:GntR family transcriptional regulator [Bacteroidia bacterium]
MKIAPLEKELISDLVAEKLIEFIENANLKPGDLLPTENDLAKAFQVGRTSVREGISKLKDIGLLYSIQGYGTVLSESSIATFFDNISSTILDNFVNLNLKDYQEINETRILLEKSALIETLDSNKEINLYPLNIILRKMDKAIKSNDKTLFASLDLEFHYQLIKLTENKMFAYLFEFIKSPFLEQMQKHCSKMSMETILNDHYEILAGIKKREVATIKLLEDHLYYLI